MKISLSYLRNFLSKELNPTILINDLTLRGFEVEGVSYPYKNIDEKILIVEIISSQRHPSNPELNIVNITDGRQDITVVCGAKNVRSGAKGVWAPPGTKILGFEIKEKNFNGIKSFGMLLSLEELNLEEKSEGIWLFSSKKPAGTPIIDILEKDTAIIDLNITPNRGDALSYIGIARELAAYYNAKVIPPPAEVLHNDKDSPISIEVENQIACPLYQGTFAEGINIKESDILIQKVLIESGLRPINNIVDLSNLVMLETGHPNHTFDFSYIKGGRIIVRNARNGERIRLLNGVELSLTPQNLLICDESSPLALAGIMGSEYGSILKDTKYILLECAIFDPITIRLSTSMFNLNSESSYRFARGVNPETVDYATKRFMYLLKQELPETTIFKTTTIKNPNINTKKTLRLHYKKVDKILGRKIDRNFVDQTLSNLGIKIVMQDSDSILLEIPSHRYDISLEEDIIEEVARIYGYNNFGFTLPHTEIFEINTNIRDRFSRLILRFLSNLGLNEVINYSFISDEVNALFSSKKPIILKNPIAQNMASMRKSLIPSLIHTATLNINRQNRDIRIFEKGKVFFGDQEITENEHLGILLSGKTHERIWANVQRDYDFFDIKGIIENLLKTLNIKDPDFTKNGIPEFMHSGKSAILTIDGQTIGLLGELHPRILKKFDIKQNLIIAEMSLDAFFESFISSPPEFKNFSISPAIDRDIAIVVPKDIPSIEMIREIENLKSSIVEKVSIFDIYEGSGIEEGKKSIGISIRYRSNEYTLTDEEIEKIHTKIVDILLKKFYGKLR
ncbi:MAG: phenylalanine--tRNA ligase subunit beta [Deltaproteobacteria bacterium]|nr:phenylalanine--tRNA ligase subunit beta [Deltaproteobacteria bacterium]